MDRVKSKLMRIQMSESLRALIEAIPKQDLTEEHGSTHVYRAAGTCSFGMQKTKILVEVGRSEDGVWAVLQTPSGTARLPFRTEDDRSAAPTAAQAALRSILN